MATTDAMKGLRPSEVEGQPDYSNERVFRRNTLPARSYHVSENVLSLNGQWDFHYAPTTLHAPEPITGTDLAHKDPTEHTDWASIQDVFLLALPTLRIEDWFLTTHLDANYEDATLKAVVDVKTTSTSQVEVALFELSKNGGERIATVTTVVSNSGRAMLNLDVTNPRKWTAETPHLYSVRITLSSDSDGEKAHHSVVQTIGFRQVELKNGLICVNGQPLRIRGVNRHEHHPRFGRSVPCEFMKRDLLLMKQHNINSLRCSHYPSQPRLFELADELGLWVMDEADLECHGFYDAVKVPRDFPAGMDYEGSKSWLFPLAAAYTSDNPTWRDAYLDRAEQTVHRDKNHTSVVSWSLGNEAFFGQNHKAMRDWIKSYDPTRLVHYEGDIEAECTDMYSYMYPSIERLNMLATTAGIAKDGTYTKPVILCEYGHAMSNAPGGLDDYEEAFRTNPRLQGGFIWEWANHGLWKEEADGKAFYAYGGDFGESPHDGNFVMDGLVDSTHSPTLGLLELAKVIEPVRMNVEGFDLLFSNLYNFVGLDHLVATYKVEELGVRSKILASGSINIPETAPGMTSKTSLPDTVTQVQSSEDVFLTVTLSLRHLTPWAEAGNTVAWMQHPLKVVSIAEGPAATRSPATSSSPLKLEKSRTTMNISGQDFAFIFDVARGQLVDWTVDGMALFEPCPQTGSAIIPGFWRAPTDNDVQGEALAHWRRYGVDAFTSQLRSLTTDTRENGAIVVSITTLLSPPILDWGFVSLMRYTIWPAGIMAIDIDLTPTGCKPDHLPRIGLDLRIPTALFDGSKTGEAQEIISKEKENTHGKPVTWKGLGPGESYPDKAAAQRMGIWTASLESLHTAYEKPQEGGNRMRTSWLSIADDSLRISGDDFSFAVSRYSNQVVENAAHPCDLVQKQVVLLRLDAQVSGLGTEACGPPTRADLLVRPERKQFSFVLSSK